MSVEAYVVFFGVMAFLWGACIGSFLNVCIYRVPRDESVVKPRSHCPHCGTMIPWHQNIPIVSYLALRARCAKCGGRISSRYVLVEALVGVLFLLVWLKVGYLGDRPPLGLVPAEHWVLAPIYWLAVAGLVLGTFVDFEHYIIPDRVTLGGIAAGLFLSAVFPVMHGRIGGLASLLQSAIGLAVGWGLLWMVAVVGRMIFKKDAMGFGDVKLLGAIGAFLGWQAVLFTVIVSSFIGSLAGLTLVIAKRKAMQSRIPYGPYLALAALLWMLWGSHWWQWYVDLVTPAPAAYETTYYGSPD